MDERYSVSTSLRTVEAFAERLLARESTLRTDDPSPSADEHDILVNLDDPNRIRLRHTCSAEQVQSPILELTFHPAPHGQYIVWTLLPVGASFSAAERANDEAFAPPKPEPAEVALEVVLWDWESLVERVFGRLFRFTVRMLDGFVNLLSTRQYRKGVALYSKKLMAVVEEVAADDETT
mgnify:CR=1 FL=1